MSLEQLLAWIPPGSPDETLARQVNFDQLPAHIAIIRAHTPLPQSVKIPRPEDMLQIKAPSAR